jgi:hypothetical protein
MTNETMPIMREVKKVSAMLGGLLGHHHFHSTCSFFVMPSLDASMPLTFGLLERLFYDGYQDLFVTSFQPTG